jgi:tetratricopeptide (TPR) repeat protein
LPPFVLAKTDTLQKTINVFNNLAKEIPAILQQINPNQSPQD